MRLIVSLFLLWMAGSLFAQPTSDEQLATYYFQNGDFEKAALYYEKLYIKNPTDIHYDFLLKCFIERKEFEKARKHVKSRIKTTKSIKYTIDLGYVYEREENLKKSTETFEKVIKELPVDASQILQVSNY